MGGRLARQLTVFVNQVFKMFKSIGARRVERVKDKGMLEHGFHPVCDSV